MCYASWIALVEGSDSQFSAPKERKRCPAFDHFVSAQLCVIFIMTTTKGKTALQQFWHRLVGVRGATNIFQQDPTLVSSSTPSSSSSSTTNFGHVYHNAVAAQEIAQHRLVFLGEIHSMPPIIAFQRQVQASMVQQVSMSKNNDAQVHVILEHFSFDLQGLLDEYCSGKWTFEELVQKYHELGEEGHDLLPYQELLQDAKTMRVRLHAGFLPRRFAKMLLQQGPEPTVQAASAWLPALGDLHGTLFHYNVFESLLTGRSIYHSNQEPTDQFKRIFDAQVLKDVGMAHKVNTLIEESNSRNRNRGDDSPADKFLVIAGNGHLLHYCGVPERVLKEHPELAKDTCLVISESTENGKELDDNPKKFKEALENRFGKEGCNPADYAFLYEPPPEVLNEW
jgi:uncharacterized iron-regulated protein